ncbi:hypothetical protein CR513_16008, partial [Mucuna pruriens]
MVFKRTFYDSTYLKEIQEQILKDCEEILDGEELMQELDNIIISQEVFHFMWSRKDMVGWMAIKIDLEKAYDRSHRSFVRDTLKDI